MKRCVIFFLIFMVAGVLFAEKVNDRIEKRSTIKGKTYEWESGTTEFANNDARDSRSVPNLIDYQGKITDSASNPITISVSITFAIYSVSTGGSNLWTETHSSVTPVDGLVHVLLGSQIDFDPSPFNGSDLWLGIKVGGDSEMTPRLRIVSVPYAIYAETAETDNDWTISGSYSLAAGSNNTVVSAYSLAHGLNNNITTNGHYATALGANNTINRPYSLAAGSYNSIDGSYAMALGRYLTAQAYNSFAIGKYNVVSGTWDTWVDSEPLFLIGNGSDASNRSNALTVFKDGRTTIGSDTRGEMLTVEGIIESTTDGFKFPDGTTQTTAAGTGGGDITGITAGTGLTGGGTSGDITLNVEVPLNLSGNASSPNSVIKGENTGTGSAISGHSEGYYGGYFTSDLGNDNTHVIHAEYTGSSTINNPIAVYGESNYNNHGYGGWFEGGLMGLYARVSPVGSATYHGVYGYINGGYGTNYGVYGHVNGGTGTNYGIYGTASGAGTNYAGYFNGNVRISGEFHDSSGNAGTSGQVLSSTLTGTNWVDAGGNGDITAVTAGTGLSGGGDTGDVTLNVNVPLDLTGSATEVIKGTTTLSNGYGVYGKHNNSGNYGYLGSSTYGVYGYNSATIGSGIYGSTASNSGYGIYGLHVSSSNYGNIGSSTHGVYGCNNASNGYGVHGYNTGSGGSGVYGYSTNANAGVYGLNEYGAYGRLGWDEFGVYGYAPFYDEYSRGGYFIGGKYGTYSSIHTLEDGDYYGFYSWINGGSGTNYGIWCYANGTGTNYSIYGYALSSIHNYAGYFNGNVHYTGNLSHPADERFKENVQPFNHALSKIKLMNVHTFNFKQLSEEKHLTLPEGNQIGLVAQELEEILPELVTDDVHSYNKNEGIEGAESDMENIEYKGINYIGLIPVLIGGMKEQQEQIEKQQQQIEELLRLISELQ